MSRDADGVPGDRLRVLLPRARAQLKFSTAGSNSCAVASGGYVYCWGSNTTGQLSNAKPWKNPVLMKPPLPCCEPGSTGRAASSFENVDVQTRPG